MKYKREVTKVKIMYNYGYIKILETIFLRKPSYLVIFLWIWVIALSFIKETVTIPKSYFSNKKNLFNQFFVKQGWAWTLVVVGPYMIVSSFVYSAVSWKNSVLRSVIRLIIATALWYLWVQIVFRFIENITGICVNYSGLPNLNITDKVECIMLKNGHHWNGFDISGHCFLLIYSLLIINSELQVQKNWIEIEQSLSNYILQISKDSTVFKKRYLLTFDIIITLFIINCLLITIWFIMLSSTCLYFHTFFQKVLGAMCAIISWMVTYNEWFKSRFSPGLPADGQLHGLLPKSLLKNQ